MLLLARLKFRSGLTVGDGDAATPGILHSDTLFSAVLNQWVKLYPGESITDLIAKLNTGPPPLTISSAFPYLSGDYYLPTPYGTKPLYMRKLNDVPFLNLTDFLDLARGHGEKIINRRLKNPLNDLVSKFVAPRVTIDRLSRTTNLYEASGWVINEAGGLYFLIRLEDESLTEKIRAAVTLLGESGIGGDRSVGYGLFVAEFESLEGNDAWCDLFAPWEGNEATYCTLSLCCPQPHEQTQAISYRIISRKGWIFSTSSTKQMKRRECRMFTEGSLFKKKIKGQVLDVTPSQFLPDHNVYRYGKAMLVQGIW